MRVRQWAVAAVVTVAVGGLAVVAPAPANAQVERVRMVSETPEGTPGSGWSGAWSTDFGSDRSASRDGRYVAFDSHADDLAPGSTPCPGDCFDVFVKDMSTGEVVQLSVGMGGAAPDGSSKDPSMSADGRFVVFTSQATNLVPDAAEYSQHVLRHDRTSGVTELVTTDLGSDMTALEPTISDDGRYVSYYTRTWHEIGHPFQVFLRDMSAATTALVSHTASGGWPDATSQGPVISGNGRYVAYWTSATDVDADVPNTSALSSVYRWDRQTDTTVLISRATNGADGDGGSYDPSISRDGSVVAFLSSATNYGIPNPSGHQVYVRNLRLLPTTTPASLAGDETAANAGSGAPSISADGRYVAFGSGADNLVPGDTNEIGDVFVRDRRQGTTARVSLSATGAESEGLSSGPAITADGTQVVFGSLAENLVPDGNNRRDVFIGPADGVQVPAAPLTITNLSCNRTLRATVCTVAYTGGAEQVRIAWTANNVPVPDARNRTTMTKQCQLSPIFNLTVSVTVTDDLGTTAQRSVSTFCA